jgi:hypothetical protein
MLAPLNKVASVQEAGNKVADPVELDAAHGDAGRLLEAARIVSGLTIKDMCDRMQVSKFQYSKFISGAAPLHLGRVLLLPPSFQSAFVQAYADYHDLRRHMLTQIVSQIVTASIVSGPRKAVPRVAGGER